MPPPDAVCPLCCERRFHSVVCDDVVSALNAIVPYDWRGYLQRKVYEIAPQAPLEGITKGGYNLVYTDEPTKWIKNAEAQGKYSDLTYSGGFAVSGEGKVGSVLWGSPAFKAGLTIGTQVVAVNGHAFDSDALKDAIKAAKGNNAPISLLLKNDNFYRTVNLDWHGGLRYPRLQKIGKGDGTLDALLAPR